MEQIIFDFIRLEDEIVDDICQNIPAETFSEKLSVAKEMNYCGSFCKKKGNDKGHKAEQSTIAIPDTDAAVEPFLRATSLVQENPKINRDNAEQSQLKTKRLTKTPLVLKHSSEGDRKENYCELKKSPFHLKEDQQKTNPDTYLLNQSFPSDGKQVQNVPIKFTLSDIVKQSEGESTMCNDSLFLCDEDNHGPLAEHYKFMDEDVWGYSVGDDITSMKSYQKSPCSSSTSGVDEDFDEITHDFERKMSPEDLLSFSFPWSSILNQKEGGALQNGDCSYLLSEDSCRHESVASTAGSAYSDSNFSEVLDKVLSMAIIEPLMLNTETPFTTVTKLTEKTSTCVSDNGRSFSGKEQVKKAILNDNIPQITLNGSRDIENKKNCCRITQSVKNFEEEKLTAGKDCRCNGCDKKMDSGKMKLDETDELLQENSKENKVTTNDTFCQGNLDSQIIQSHKLKYLLPQSNFSYILDETRENQPEQKNVKINIDMIHDIDFPLKEDGRLDFSKMNLWAEKSKTTRVKIRIPTESEHSRELGQQVMRCLLSQLDVNSEKLLDNREDFRLELDSIDSVTEYYV